MHRIGVNLNIPLPVGPLDAGGVLCRWLILAPWTGRVWDVNSPQIRLEVDHIALNGANIIATDDAKDMAFRIRIDAGYNEIVVALRVLFLLPRVGCLCSVDLTQQAHSITPINPLGKKLTVFKSS